MINEEKFTAIKMFTIIKLLQRGETEKLKLAPFMRRICLFESEKILNHLWRDVERGTLYLKEMEHFEVKKAEMNNDCIGSKKFLEGF
jgi:hypothetical protein